MSCFLFVVLFVLFYRLLFIPVPPLPLQSSPSELSETLSSGLKSSASLLNKTQLSPFRLCFFFSSWHHDHLRLLPDVCLHWLHASPYLVLTLTREGPFLCSLFLCEVCECSVLPSLPFWRLPCDLQPGERGHFSPWKRQPWPTVACCAHALYWLILSGLHLSTSVWFRTGLQLGPAGEPVCAALGTYSCVLPQREGSRAWGGWVGVCSSETTRLGGRFLRRHWMHFPRILGSFRRPFLPPSVWVIPHSYRNVSHLLLLFFSFFFKFQCSYQYILIQCPFSVTDYNRKCFYSQRNL